MSVLQFVSRSAVALALMARAAALAELPDPHVLTYEMHQDPQQPESPLLYRVEVLISADQTASGNTVAWRVDEVTTSKFDAAGQVKGVWLDDTPDVVTADGLWHVTHADPRQPELEEFRNSPEIKGTAPSVTGGAAMHYSLRDTGQSQTIYLPGAVVDVLMWPVGLPVPSLDDEDVPVYVFISTYW